MKISRLLLGILILTVCSEGSKKIEVPSDEIIERKEVKTEQIELFAEQFKWTIRYSGSDNTLGEFDYKLTTDLNPLAIMTSDAIDASLYEIEYGELGILELQAKHDLVVHNQMQGNLDEISHELNNKERLARLLVQMKKRHNSKVDAFAMDDIILTDTLVLCLNQEYEFNFRSKDVIHSAYFPHFRAQMNTVPGMITRIKYTPTITTKEMRRKENDTHFEFLLMCNKICGSGHNSMKMIVRVVEKEEYNSWILKKSSSSFEKTLQEMELVKNSLSKGVVVK